MKAKKYYTRKELDEYVTKLMTNTEVTLMEQRERILELKQENAALVSEIAQRKKLEKDEKKASQKASRTATAIIEDTKRKCAKELLKVKEFALAWHAQFEELAKKYKIKETTLADKLVIETDAISKQYSSYVDESDKTIDKRFSTLLARVKEKRKADAVEESKKIEEAFSIEEALNPVDPLDAILKDLLK